MFIEHLLCALVHLILYSVKHRYYFCSNEHLKRLPEFAQRGVAELVFS